MSMSKEKNILDTIRSKQPNYPDAEFFERMAENVIAEHSSPFIKIPFYKNPVVRWIAAAAILVPFVFFFAQKNQSSSQAVSLAELDVLPQESIREYVAEQESESILLAFEPTSSTENSTVRKTINQLTENIGEKEISNYLLEEYGDWESIEEAYLFY